MYSEENHSRRDEYGNEGEDRDRGSPMEKIVLDVVPSAGEIAVGARVLAQWGSGFFYPGEISAISGDSYDIQYDDGD